MCDGDYETNQCSRDGKCRYPKFRDTDVEDCELGIGAVLAIAAGSLYLLACVLIFVCRIAKTNDPPMIAQDAVGMDKSPSDAEGRETLDTNKAIQEHKKDDSFRK